ncbi:MAG: calcium/sodium antiporter [Flavobacteriaceae bacterium]|jgi:cation:H+ antiporter|nr:calcium/sodium antiporter [Flavobacteriaceae bacterium]
MSAIYVLLGLTLLTVGGDFLVRGAVALSFRLNLSKMVIGMTVVSFATSAPELLVSLNAALEGSSAIAINNVVGSNIANIGLVLGLTGMVGLIAVDRSFFRLNWPAMMIFSLALCYFIQNDGIITRIEGLILIVAMVVFVLFLLKTSSEPDMDEVNEATLSQVSLFKLILCLTIGGVALYMGSEFLVVGAIDLAKAFNVSETVISVSVVAIGTSVPELAASLIAVVKKEKAISMGNLIGSNIFNIGTVIGVTAMIIPIPVTDAAALNVNLAWMIAYAVGVALLILLPKRLFVNRPKGLILFFSYMIFMYLTFSTP